jgi:hypothetical protein
MLFFVLSITVALIPSIAYANAADQRPFWAEQASYTLAQVDTLNNLQVETQMTYEEPQSNGKVNVWRLLRVSMGDLRVVVKAREGHYAPLVSAVPSTVATVPTAPATVVAAPRSVVPSPKVQRQQSGTTSTGSVQRMDVPPLPPHMVHVINGWTRDSHGQVAVASHDRRDWQVELVKPSDLSYSR